MANNAEYNDKQNVAAALVEYRELEFGKNYSMAGKIDTLVIFLKYTIMYMTMKNKLLSLRTSNNDYAFIFFRKIV